MTVRDVPAALGLCIMRSTFSAFGRAVRGGPAALEDDVRDFPAALGPHRTLSTFAAFGRDFSPALGQPSLSLKSVAFERDVRDVHFGP